MQFFFSLVFVIVIAIALFAVQNSGAAPIAIRFIFWKFETSLVYTILGSIGLGMLITLLVWIPRAVRTSVRRSRQGGGLPPSP